MITQTVGRKFSEKLAYTLFTNTAVVTFTPTVWTHRDQDLSRPFKEGAIVNNLDTDIEVYDSSDANNLLFIIKAQGGSATFSKQDLLGIYEPLLLINNTGSNATSGNVSMVLIR